MDEEIKWTIEYWKGVNERLRKVGMPQVIIDEENKMVYKDDVHMLLGLGVKLES